MNALTEGSAKVELARAPEFRLGGLHVRPSACRVGEQRVEPRVMEVLIVLARAGGETVTRDELIEVCWGGRIVGDDAIARAIAQVRALARGMEPAPFAIETIPKVGFRLIAGGEAAAPASGTSTRPAIIWRRALIAAVLLAVLAAGGWAAWRYAGGASGQNGRVEVMMFEPLQADPAVRRISVSLSDAIVRRLTTNGVETAQRARPVDAMGPSSAELRIAGTVERDGDKYVANAQILDRRSGDVLWSGRLDRSAANPAGFQEEAANQIADLLHCALGSRAASNKPMSSAVFGLFLNACEHRRSVEGSPARFLEATERLVRAAPDLSAAHSMHAVALGVTMATAPGGEAGSRRVEPLLRAAANRALALDPRNGEAYFALGIGGAGLNANWLERERNFQRASELSPQLSVVRNYSVDILRQVGRLSEAMDLNRRTTASDAFSAWQLRSLAFMSAAAGDFQTTERLNEQIALLSPFLARDTMFQTAFWWRDPSEGLAALRATADDHPASDFNCFEAYLVRLSRHPRARGLPAECRDVQLDWRIRMLAREGDLDAAYALPLRFDESGTFMTLFYPEMKAFRQDPRFMPFAKRAGLVDYWTKSGHWPDFCSEPDLPYDCKRVAEALR